MNDESMPSIYEIFDYWKDEKIKEIEIVEDYYYPRCWACDKEIKHNEKSEDLKIIWNSVKTYSLGFNFFAIQDEIKTLIEILNIDLDEMERILKKRNEKRNYKS